MKETVIGIHPLHRKLAEVTLMALDSNGDLVIGRPELKLIMPLLRQNLELIQQLDEYKQLAFLAYEMGDMEWMMDLTAKIDELESKMEV